MKINIKKLKGQITETGLIVLIVSFVLCFLDYTHFNGINEEDDHNILKKICNRIYFATTTISSVGYGDIYPKTYTAKIIISILQILVVVNLISMIGNY